MVENNSAWKDGKFTGATKCPSCGSEERAIGPLFQEMVKDKPEAFKTQLPPGLQLQAPLPFALNALMTAMPVMTINFDACAKCGTMYVISGTITEQPVRVPNQMGPGPMGLGGGRMPPHMGRG